MNNLFKYLLFVIFYIYSNNIFISPYIEPSYNYYLCDKKFLPKFNEKFNNYLFKHEEIIGNIFDFILCSSVCPLAKLVFYTWIIILPFFILFLNKYNIFYKLIKYGYYLTIILSGLMNPPLFIRSIPSFYVLYKIIFD